MYYDPTVCEWAMKVFKVIHYIHIGWFPEAKSEHLYACDIHAQAVLKMAKIQHDYQKHGLDF